MVEVSSVVNGCKNQMLLPVKFMKMSVCTSPEYMKGNNGYHIFIVNTFSNKPILTHHKKWSFPLRISSVNMTKSAVFCGFGHIYWRNP